MNETFKQFLKQNSIVCGTVERAGEETKYKWAGLEINIVNDSAAFVSLLHPMYKTNITLQISNFDSIKNRLKEAVAY